MGQLFYASLAEQRAVAWFRSSYRGMRGGVTAYALQELAYDPYHRGRDWRRPHNGVSRVIWSHWQCRPFGNEQFNRNYQLARLCIRRNIYFPDMARQMGRRRWDDPTTLK